MPPRRRIGAVYAESFRPLRQQCAPAAAATSMAIPSSEGSAADYFLSQYSEEPLGEAAISTKRAGPRAVTREAGEEPVMARVRVQTKQAREGGSDSRAPGSGRGAQAQVLPTSFTRTASSRLPHHPPRHRPRPQQLPSSTPPGPISPHNPACRLPPRHPPPGGPRPSSQRQRRLGPLPRLTPSNGPHRNTAVTLATRSTRRTQGIGTSSRATTTTTLRTRRPLVDRFLLGNMTLVACPQGAVMPLRGCPARG